MGRTIALQLQDGSQISAYVAEPAGTPKGGLVVVQEIFGVNPHIRSVADRYAQQGYLAIAPALFDPVKPGVELDYNQQGMEQGFDLVGKLGFDRALAGVEAAAKQVASAGRVGVVGYCWGGSVTYLAAIRLGLPGISYYGGRNVQFVGEKAKAPLLFHYGLHDAHIPEADREAVHQANPDAEYYVYDADHGFNCDARGSYNAAAAKLALERSLAFLARHVG